MHLCYICSICNILACSQTEGELDCLEDNIVSLVCSIATISLSGNLDSNPKHRSRAILQWGRSALTAQVRPQHEKRKQDSKFSSFQNPENRRDVPMENDFGVSHLAPLSLFLQAK